MAFWPPGPPFHASPIATCHDPRAPSAALPRSGRRGDRWQENKGGERRGRGGRPPSPVDLSPSPPSTMGVIPLPQAAASRCMRVLPPLPALRSSGGDLHCGMAEGRRTRWGGKGRESPCRPHSRSCTASALCGGRGGSSGSGNPCLTLRGSDNAPGQQSPTRLSPPAGALSERASQAEIRRPRRPLDSPLSPCTVRVRMTGSHGGFGWRSAAASRSRDWGYGAVALLRRSSLMSALCLPHV